MFVSVINALNNIYDLNIIYELNFILKKYTGILSLIFILILIKIHQ